MLVQSRGPFIKPIPSRLGTRPAGPNQPRAIFFLIFHFRFSALSNGRLAHLGVKITFLSRNAPYRIYKNLFPNFFSHRSCYPDYLSLPVLVHEVFLGNGVSANFVTETVIIRVVVGGINFSRFLAWIEARE